MGKEDRSRKGRKNCESCEKTGNGNGLGESGTWRTGQMGDAASGNCVYWGIPVPSGLGGEGAVFGGVFYAAAAVCVSGDGKSGGCVFRRDRCRERMML